MLKFEGNKGSFGREKRRHWWLTGSKTYLRVSDQHQLRIRTLAVEGVDSWPNGGGAGLDGGAVAVSSGSGIANCFWGSTWVGPEDEVHDCTGRTVAWRGGGLAGSEDMDVGAAGLARLELGSSEGGAKEDRSSEVRMHGEEGKRFGQIRMGIDYQRCEDGSAQGKARRPVEIRKAWKFMYLNVRVSKAPSGAMEMSWA
jgi:hypothetical protein